MAGRRITPVRQHHEDQIVTIDGLTGISLKARAPYFLVVDPGAADTWDAWNWNTIGATGLHLVKIDDGDWTARHDDPLGAFDVLGTAIPEPPALAMFGMGVIGFGITRRWRSRRH